MDKFLLKLLPLFKGLITKQGVDYDRMLLIVQNKLLMDKRRVYVSWKTNQQEKENQNRLTVVLLMYLIMGVFVAAIVGVSSSLILGMILMHSYVLFMMAMTLITDFSTVLLDTTDNQVILPRPVSSKTLFLSRLVHILIYILQFTIALAVLPLLAAFIRHGLVAGLVCIVTVFLTVLMAVFLTYLLYMLIIKFSSEKRVKDIVSFFQIFMTILFTAGFQLLPRFISLRELGMLFELHWYSYLLPPVWMALTVEAFARANFDSLHIAMIVLSFAVPIFSFWLMNKYLAPSFTKKLAAMGAGDSSTAKQRAKATAINKSLSDTLSNIVCKSPLEKSGFLITWKVTGRDKTFKMQFYPSLAYLFVFAFIIIFKNGRNISSLWNDLPNTSGFLWFFYLPMMTLGSSLTLATFNENFAASWIYHSTPINNPGEIILGMIKSLYTKFFIPIFTIIAVFCVYVWGIAILDDCLFAAVNNLLCFLVFQTAAQHYLPFSRQPNTQQQTGKFIKMILQLIVVAVVVLIHFLLNYLNIGWLLWVLLPAFLFVCWMLLKGIRQISWNKIAV